MPISPEEIAEFLSSGEWRNLFDGSALAEGQKLARARTVSNSHAEALDTGDVEICSTVTQKDAEQFHSTIAFWREDGVLAFDASCDCDIRANCRHNVATLERLNQVERLQTAFGQTPQADEAKGAEKNLRIDEPEVSKPSTDNSPTFLIRVERRPEGNDRLEWLPEIYAHAHAIYHDEHQVSLSPSGKLNPIVTPEEKIHRDRVAEMEALQLLYAIDLLPGAEEPPHSLRKHAKPPQDGTLWSPDRKKWPHPEFYWQRFRHEATMALEQRGWQVQFAPHVGHKPLVFRTETWEAQIIEEGRGWFNLSAGFEIDGEQFELQPILATLVENEFLEATEGMPRGQEFMIFLPDGRGLALPVGRFRNILITLGSLLEFKFTDGPIKLSKLDAAALSEEEDLQAEAPEEIKEVAARATDFSKIERVPVPTGLKADLRQYQLDGYHWMQFLARYELNGILADDMGLGKTLQTIAHILAEKESGRDAELPSLVIAPTSVVENWQREAAKFAPDLEILILQGHDRASRYAQIPSADIVLTSYALIHRDLDVFTGYQFHILALDEAQHIKNPGAKVSGAVRQLDAKHRLCLSGTPIENHLGELWSLMDFLMPGMLGTAEAFNETYRTPIERNGSASKSKALADRVGPLILRRTKNDVAKELPPKTEITHHIDLGEQQKDLYETVRATMDKKVRDALALQGTQSQIVFLDALMKLRQICCHPTLLKDQSHATESSKFEFLTDLLQTLRREGHRVLLFSQFTSMLSIIEEHLVEENCTYLKLTGETKNRQELVERFQGGEAEVFLISLKAGGTGLTLTGADTVIHYDPWWNPAAENQATDRAYRIGQDKPVIVHKLICKNTVEERIQQMQGKKDNLATDLLSGATQSLSLTKETLAELLGS